VVHNENDHDDEQNTADMEHDLRDHLADNLSGVLGDNPIEPEPPMQWEITSMPTMLEEQREILNHAIQHNTQLYLQNAELMEDNLQYCR